MDTIYSVGDPLILENVLNAIAMVCGTGDFTAAVSIGGLLGVIIMGFESVLTQKGFNLPAFTVCVIAFTFFFGKTSTVYIEDVYSGDTRKVSNVPSGVAFTGEAISNIGYGLTRLMEQAFQSVTATTTLTGPGGHGSPFGDALYVLNTFSRIGSSDTLINAIDMANGNADGTVGAGSKLTSGDPADFRYSASNYVKDCTITAVQLRYKTFEGIYHASVTNDGNGTGSRANAIALDSPNYFTRICEGGGKNCRTVSCADGYAAITGMMAKLSGKALQRAINSVVDHDRSGVDPTTGKSLGDLDGEERINSALQLLNIGSNEAMKLAQASIWDDMLYLGQQKFFADGRDFTSAAMINNARRQRNVQFASEGEMFKNAARPCMAFIEAFAYGIAPFAGILLMMGVFGIKLALKYFMLLLWVQSWLPVMAIVNSYMSSALRRGMLELQGLSSEYSNGAAFDSMYTVNKLAEVTSDWIGHSGLFLSLIPVLTLFLFSGSMYALTAFTNRMSGGDFINEKTHVPDALQNGPVVQGLPGATAALGVAKTGGYELGSISLSHAVHNTTASKHAESERLSSTLAAGLTKGWSDIQGIVGKDGISTALTNAYNGLSAEAQNTVKNLGDAIQSDSGFRMDDSARKEMAMRMGIAASAGIKAGGVSTMLEIAKSYGMNDSQAQAAVQAVSSAMSGGLSSSSSHMGEVARQVAGSLKKDQSFEKSSSLSGSVAANVSRQAQEAREAADTYENAKSKEVSSGYTENISLDQLARELNRNGGRDAVVQIARPLMDQDQSGYQALYNYYMDAGAGSQPNAELMAAADLISRKGTVEQQMALSTAYHGGFSGVELTSPLNNVHVDSGTIRNQLGSNVGTAESGAAAIAAQAGSARKVRDGGENGIRTTANGNMQQAKEFGRNAEQEAKRKAIKFVDDDTQRNLDKYQARLGQLAAEGAASGTENTIGGEKRRPGLLSKESYTGRWSREAHNGVGNFDVRNIFTDAQKHALYTDIVNAYSQNGGDYGAAVDYVSTKWAAQEAPQAGADADTPEAQEQAAAFQARRAASIKLAASKIVPEIVTASVEGMQRTATELGVWDGSSPENALIAAFRDKKLDPNQWTNDAVSDMDKSESRIRGAFGCLTEDEINGLVYGADKGGVDGSEAYKAAQRLDGLRRRNPGGKGGMKE